MAQRKSTAKKSAAKKATVKKAQQRAPGERVPMMLRLPKDVHDVIAKRSEEAGISMSLLTEGLLAACTQRLIPGEPVKEPVAGYDIVTVNEKPGCFFCGKPGVRYVLAPPTYEDAEKWQGEGKDFPKMGPHDKATLDERKAGRVDPGVIWFVLDYSSSPVRFGDE